METCPSCVSLRQQIAALRDEWRKRAQTHRNYAHHRDEPYDDVGHEHRVKARTLDSRADELDALLAPEASAPTTEQE
jgi:hypothetical protein